MLAKRLKFLTEPHWWWQPFSLKVCILFSERECEIMSQWPDQTSIYMCTKNILCKHHWMLSLMTGCLLVSVMSVQCINLSKLIFLSLIKPIAIFHSFKLPVQWNIIFTYQGSVMCSQWLLIGDNYKKINLHSAVQLSLPHPCSAPEDFLFVEDNMELEWEWGLKKHTASEDILDFNLLV